MLACLTIVCTALLGNRCRFMTFCVYSFMFPCHRATNLETAALQFDMLLVDGSVAVKECRTQSTHSHCTRKQLHGLDRHGLIE